MNEPMNTFQSFVKLPIYELDNDNIVKPNCAFHRSVDKLHSRCIEYPYTASQLALTKESRILDCGTIKSGIAWISWLESLECEVYATDYDQPFKQFKNIIFEQADIRKLPYPDNFFDFVSAVSVIEHIGLESCQVIDTQQPKPDSRGDVNAIREITRVLKPHGKLVMTVPYGLNDGLILGGDARAYGIDSFHELISSLKQVRVDYFEYQSIYTRDLHEDSPKVSSVRFMGRLKARFGRLEKLFKERITFSAAETLKNPPLPEDELDGPISWKRIDIGNAKARNQYHIDGVVCCVLEKVC
jgi:SAM-dependent methyltransferase